MIARPTWHQRLMMHAELWSLDSTCLWGSSGSVVVDPDCQVIVSAFNGAPRGAPHCADSPRERVGRCNRCLHSERNCINQAARVGVSIRGCTMYTTMRPCIDCALSLTQVGLAIVRYRDDYDSDGLKDEAIATMRRSGIAVVQQVPSQVEHEFSILLHIFKDAWPALVPTLVNPSFRV